MEGLFQKQSMKQKGAVGMTHMARVLLFGLFGEKVDYKLALEYLSAASQLRSYPETFFVLGQVYYCLSSSFSFFLPGLKLITFFLIS